MKNKETNQIKDCWNALSRAFDAVSYHKHVDRLLDASMSESKRHDNFRGSDIKRGISVLTEARYFAIKRLAEYIADDCEVPNLKNYLSTQTSVYVAYALAQSEETREYALNWYNKYTETIQLISSWDYSELIQDEDRRRGFKSSPVSEVTL